MKLQFAIISSPTLIALLMASISSLVHGRIAGNIRSPSESEQFISQIQSHGKPQIGGSRTLVKTNQRSVFEQDQRSVFEQDQRSVFDQEVIDHARKFLDQLPGDENYSFVTDEMILDQAKLIGLDEDQAFGQVTISSVCECVDDPSTPENECLEGCELDVVIDAVGLVLGILPIPSSSIRKVASRLIDSLPPGIRKRIVELILSIPTGDAVDILIEVFMLIFNNLPDGGLNCAFAGFGLWDYLGIAVAIASILATGGVALVIFLAGLALDIVNLVNSIFICFG